MKTHKTILAASLITLLATATPASASFPDTIKTRLATVGNWFNKNRAIGCGIAAAAMVGVALYCWMRNTTKRSSSEKITVDLHCSQCNQSRNHALISNDPATLGAIASCTHCKTIQNVSHCNHCNKYVQRTTSGECPGCSKQ